MKIVFRFLLAISVMAFVGGCYQSLGVMAHTHTGDRYRTLNGLQKPVSMGDHRNGYFGLTRDELSKDDGLFAQAYEASLGEASRFQAGYEVLLTEYDILAVLLFSTSLLGLRALNEKASFIPLK